MPDLGSPSGGGCSPLPLGVEEPGDAVVLSRYRNTPSGPANHGYYYRVFYDSVELDPAKQVYTITLPANGSMRVFSAAIG